MMLIFVASFLSSLMAVARCQYTADQFTNVTETIESLLKGYDIRLRPSFGGDPLEIGIEVILASFDSISEVDMDYTITMYLNQYWRDERLQFIFNQSLDLGHNRSVTSMTLTGAFAEKIWVPDTFLANDKNSFLHDITEKNKMVRLNGDGSLVYGMRFTTTLACMMDLHNYPLDHQECTVEIESYGYTMDDIVLYWRNDRGAVTGVENVSLPQFSITNYDTINKIEELLTGDYQRLSLIFQLQRNIGYFIFQTYLPSILIVMLSWVSFWINHEATSARVALGITTVLTMTTISNGVRSSLPRISYVKAIDIYLVMCFVFVFAALLEYAAVNYTYWGARAKRKAKRLRERATSVRKRVDEGEPMNNTTIETMELKEVLGPLGITNSQSFSLELDDGQQDPSGFKVAPPASRSFAHSHSTSHGYIPSTVRRRSSAHVPPRRRRLLSHFRQKAKSIKVKIPRVQDVNTIDKYARLLFPLLFVIFNASYWSVYLMT
ncbi:gamma-aminobutyric acid receptor subunit beta [Physella acuta]|uniref:gamma-aminobutyric acid receptor subunit beta n=1 Tax=Physella acuta TaxID=109671 RepID=UPI0027DBE13F|nr:gamma-aminobutyric acid receptor subunit beta [Physella acuta]